MSRDIVVLHSGGQDSTTCLALAVQERGAEHVHPLQINYGQRHSIELECAHDSSVQLTGRPPAKHNLSVLSDIGGTALTDDNVQVPKRGVGADGNVFAEERGLPGTFVPGRNMLFLTVAAAYAARIGAREIMTGVCEADAAGYPDCRQEFIDAAQTALNAAVGEEDHFTIHTPLMNRSKALTWQLAADLSVLELIVLDTHTCYQGAHSVLHDWGYGCGSCGSCLERKNGFYEYRALRKADQS